MHPIIIPTKMLNATISIISAYHELQSIIFLKPIQRSTNVQKRNIPSNPNNIVYEKGFSWYGDGFDVKKNKPNDIISIGKIRMAEIMIGICA